MSDGMEQVNDNGRVLMMWRNVCKELLPFLLCLQLITFTRFLLSPQHNVLFHLKNHTKTFYKQKIWNHLTPSLIDQSAAFNLFLMDIENLVLEKGPFQAPCDLLIRFGSSLTCYESQQIWSFCCMKKADLKFEGLLECSIELCVLRTEKCLGLWL